jgi:cbb3-type cytochrome oxidase maturation protein
MSHQSGIRSGPHHGLIMAEMILAGNVGVVSFFWGVKSTQHHDMSSTVSATQKIMSAT